VSNLPKAELDKLKANVIGGTEETTTGIIRLKSMEKDKVLRFPVLAVNDAMTNIFLTTDTARDKALLTVSSGLQTDCWQAATLLFQDTDGAAKVLQ
jgi:hypothetical protein